MNTRTLTAALLALGLSACSAPFSGVAINAICYPPTPDATTGVCVYPATCDATLVGNAKLDATTARLDFRLPLQFNNQLESNASTADGRVNTNDAFIQSLEMNYSGGASIASWSVPVAITVPSAGSTSALV